MLRLFKRALIGAVLLNLALSGCRKAEFDNYYGRPDWLASPIYTKLQESGNFKLFLSLVDKAKYKETLDRAGYWTLFAPNDEAIQKFLSENNYSSINDVSEEVASKIVRYALVYNAFKTDRISDFQSNIGWVEDAAFKRRTAYYDDFYKERVKIAGGEKEIVVASSNRNNRTVNFGTPYYINGDNNNKYLTYFHKDYLDVIGVGATDFNFFYPQESFTDFNLFGAKVVKADIIAENGIIHEVNKVTLPKPSLDQYLAQNDRYSFFRDSILNKFFVSYNYNEQASKTYEYRTGKAEKVYVKTYDPLLSFSPNNENYLKEMDNDGQSDGYSMFIPTNEALMPFVNNVLLENYGTLDRVPKTVLADFVNTLLWKTSVWPSKFSNSFNELDEPARFNLNSNIVDKEILSNGFFYGTNIVQESNLFNTVFKYVILDPDYSMMLRLLNKEYRKLLLNPTQKFTVFLFSDALLKQLTYNYNERTNEWSYTDRNGNVQNSAITEARLQRILYSHIVETPNGELDNIETTKGFIQTGDKVLPGEFIKWDNNKLYSAGTVQFGEVVNIVGSHRLGNNGRVYFVDNVFEPSNRTALQDMTSFADQNANVSEFIKYINASPNSLTGVAAGSSYTILMPNNAAIAAAKTAGLLPAVTTTDPAEKVKIENFIKYHIISNVNIAPDGNRDVISALTQYKNSNDEYVTVGVNNQVNNLELKDRKNRSVKVVNNVNLYLGNRVLIHELEGYLNYLDN